MRGHGLLPDPRQITATWQFATRRSIRGKGKIDTRMRSRARIFPRAKELFDKYRSVTDERECLPAIMMVATKTV